ncbi:hypothetical protein GYY_00950 [Methanococcus maripaludis X1]|uniref:Uncharacterized protein n=1 Tax=Methanococcus maripaludis X1 TaxID=1053692 RepID=G0H1S1_METMI|nr:hypothetical protein GYY_00950 [Methanococcus maripaludis X1]
MEKDNITDFLIFLTFIKILKFTKIDKKLFIYCF